MKRAAQYPEHEKVKALGERRDAVQAFLDWLCDEKRYVIAGWVDRCVRCQQSEALCECRRFEGSDVLFPAHAGREALMADHFKINLKKLEKEKVAMLDALRAENDKHRR